MNVESEPKVSNFRLSLMHKNVLRLNVSMKNPMAMKMVASLNDLHHQGEGSRIAESVVDLNQIMKGSLGAILHAKVNCLRVFGEPIKSDNILMLYSIQNPSLSSDEPEMKLPSLDLVLAVADLLQYFFLGDLLDCAKTIILGIPACIDSCEGAGTKADVSEVESVV